MLSYWEKQSLLNYDIVVIGSGIVGLSTAVALKEKLPRHRILVLERAVLPTGASTKNAGFACIGSLTEILDDLHSMREEEVVALVGLRFRGLQKLRERLGDKAIGYSENGSYELISQAQENCLDSLSSVNKLLYPVLKGDAFTLCSKKIEQFGFCNNAVKHLVQNNYEGELHTGKMMRALIDLALQKGIEIKTGCPVDRIEEEPNAVRIMVKHTVLNEEIVFAADKVILCTNAFTKQLFPETDLRPGRGQVLITEPLANLPFKGIFHFDKGYYYFREIEGRILFGGGRNKDFKGEESTTFEFNDAVRNDLLQKLREIILPQKEFVISDWWTGIMAFGDTKHPIVERKTPRIFMGIRMGGMGVAIGTEVAEKLATMVAEA